MEIIDVGSHNINHDDYLWRYIDIHRFLSFISEKSLYFSRLDHFDDPLEGLTDELIGNIASYEVEWRLIDQVPATSIEAIRKKALSRKKYIDEKKPLQQKTQFANSWFRSNKESIAMWNLYSNADSIAIRFKPDELIKIVLDSANAQSAHEDFKLLFYGSVQYDNIWPFNFRKGSELQIKYTAFKKDTSYEHEKEFRFVVVTSRTAVDKHTSFQLALKGIEKSDFKIFAHPKMDEWKLKNLNVVLEKFGLSDRLIKSDLKVHPLL